MDRTLRGFYGFDRIPFGALDDGARPFLSEIHSQFVQSIVVAVLRGSAVTAVRGERGAGKTTLMRVVASELRLRGGTVIQVAASQQNPIAVQRLIGEAIGVERADRLKPDELLRWFPVGQGVRSLVLLIDDADALSNAMYRYLSLLLDSSGFATTKIKLVLFGQLGQWAGLGHPDLETLRRATLTNTVIPTLSTADAASYLNYKLTRAGRPLRRIMTRAATVDLVEHAQGIPGQLDELTDFALWHGHQIGRRRVTRKSLRLALGPDRRGDRPARRRVLPSVRTVAAMAAILAVAGTTLAVWIGSATHEERASETATVSRPAQDSAPRQAAALPASHPVNPTVPPAERPSLPAGTVPSTSETAATSFSPAPVAVLPSASEPDRIAALPDIHPVSPTALPAEQPPSSADNAPSAPETARASSQPSPVADSLPARESDQTAALPETRMVGTATMPPEQTSPPVDNAPSSASTSPAPAANSLSAPETDQTAALPDAHSIDPATMPAEAPSLPADNAPSTRETANGAALVTVDPTITSERIPTIVPPRRLGAPGLVLVAGTGDSLAGLYAKVYRGLKPPPYSVFVAANHTPVTPGTLVVFPEPPEGWPSR